jgi:hypothetical protein
MRLMGGFQRGAAATTRHVSSCIGYDTGFKPVVCVRALLSSRYPLNSMNCGLLVLLTTQFMDQRSVFLSVVPSIPQRNPVVLSTMFLRLLSKSML